MSTGYGFHVEAAHDRRVRAQQTGDTYRAQYRGRPACDQRREQRHDPATQLLQAMMDRNRQGDRRCAQQEVHELRALEIFRVGHIDECDRGGDQQDCDRDRIRQRMAAEPLIDQDSDLIRGEGQDQREQRASREIDPDLVDVGQVTVHAAASG